MILGGEQCVPVLEWDNIKISDKKGPACTMFQEYLESFAKNQELAEGQIKVEYDEVLE